jgi:very-short-patch-repair endonuclease
MAGTKLQRALECDSTPRTYAQLREVVSEHTIAAAQATGELTRILPDQYCLSLHAESWAMRARAAVRWGGKGAALSGLAGLAAWRFAPVPVETVQIVVPAWHHRTGPPWLRVRSLTMPFGTSTWSPGTALSSPALSLVLAYGTLPSPHRSEVLYGAIRAGLTTAKESLDLSKGLTRIPAKRELVSRLANIAAGAESYLEERAMGDVCTGPEFADIVFQHRVRVRGRSFRIDAFHPPTLTAIEFDGKERHEKPEHRLADIERDALLSSIGLVTVRFPYKDVTERPSWCRDLILDVLSHRTNCR